MTAEGYDYEYALTTIIHDQWGYGSYSSTIGTFTIEVTVDPPAWTCGSCRGHAVHVAGISASGHSKRPSARRPRSSSARSLARAHT